SIVSKVDDVKVRISNDQKQELERILGAARSATLITQDNGSKFHAVNLNDFDSLCEFELLKFFETVNPFYGKYVTVTPRETGIFRYRKSWSLSVEGIQIGIAAAGAKNGGCYISLSGAGCAGMDNSKLFY